MTTVSIAWAQTGTVVGGSGGVMVAQAAAGGRIQDIRIEGSQRIEPSTIRSYLAVQSGDPFDPDRLDVSLKSLFNTGLFADVTFRREGNTLIVSVVENPIINRIAFEGNRRIEDEQLQSEIQLRPRVVYTRTRVQNDVQRILDIYRRQGRFAATVEPKIIQLDQNRVDLVFEISEGPKTGVRKITFVGNEEFGEGTLRGQIQTKETAWWRFLSSDDSYDPDRVTVDRELLRRFYLREGYADFRVISAVAELTPDREDFFITFTIEEGPRYKFGKIDVTTNLKGLDPQALAGVVSTAEGDWYDAQAVETTIQRLTTAANNLQYAFVDVRPRIQRDRENRTISVTYEVNEGPRIFVERIDVTGNIRTLDKVVRREMLVVEGDPFNASKLRRSEQRIKDLGFFERVQVTAQEGSAPDRSVVNVEVTEQPTGEISLGAGFSTADGVLGDFAIRERNLLGRGQDLRIGATISQRRQEYDLSFTEPYFLDRDLSAGFDIFRISRDNQKESSFDERNTGFALRLGFPLGEKLRQRVYYRLEDTSVSNIPSTASVYVQDEAGTRVTSLVGTELIYDARNSRLQPTDGYYIRGSVEFSGLGGSTRFLRNRVGAGYYYPVMEDWVLSAQAEAGYIWNFDKDLFIADRFFLGGDTLRGFRTAGVGPRDTRTNDALGGKQYARGSVELSFPLGLPEEFGIRGHTFTDVGSLSDSGIDDPYVPDSPALRMAVGAGVSWRSPLGPIRFDLAYPVVKKDYDRTEVFRFSFGTRF